MNLQHHLSSIDMDDLFKETVRQNRYQEVEQLLRDKADITVLAGALGYSTISGNFETLPKDT